MPGLCALLSLTFFLILRVISPRVILFSWLLFALLLALPRLLLLFPSPPRWLLPLLSPLTCPLPRCLGYLLTPPLWLPIWYLYPLLRCLLLRVFFNPVLLPPPLSFLLPWLLLLALSPLPLLLSLPPFLSGVRQLYMGWVWVSLPLLGFPPYSSAATAHSATTSAAWLPADAYSYDPHASAAPPPHADRLDHADERFQEDEHIPLDPSAISLDSARSEYHRMVEYVCSLFPLAADDPPVEPSPRALFESFFAPVTPASQSLAFRWFERVHTTLVEADAYLVM